MRKETVLLILIGVLAIPFSLMAQKETPTIPLEKFYVDRQNHPLRGLLHNFKFGVSMGVGKTYFKHNLDGFGIYQSPTVGPYIFSGNTLPTNGYSQWISTNIQDTIINPGAGFLVTSDTAALGYKSHSFTIPLKLTIHYEFKNFRVGVGYTKDLIFIKPFTPTSYGDKLRNVESKHDFVSTNRYFLMAGYSFARVDKFLFTGDLQIGINKFGKNFNQSIITSSPTYNLGVMVERELSEYLRVFIRPSFELKSYTLALAETNQAIKHKANAQLWNVGFTYTIPELPKCKISDCRIQINHAHGNKEYRSRAHPIWKKQNPGYGEDDPTLIKYKWRNRKKINPY